MNDAKLRSVRRLRGEKGGDRVNVLITELVPPPLHQRRPLAVAGADLDVIELAIDVHRRAAGDRRNLADALEVDAVAGRAGEVLPAGAGGDDHLALREAAGRHMGDEAGAGIAALGAEIVLRQLDDTV